MRLTVAIVMLLIWSGCHSDADISNISLTDRNDTEHQLSNFDLYAATVVTFLGPECPLSENYTKTINDLDSVFSEKGVHFVNIFPGTFYSKQAIDSFINTFAVRQNCLQDEDYALVKRLHATITPETFIFDTNGKLVYSGAIDNWATDLGQKRQVITEFYVHDVLDAMLNGKPLPYTKTTAVGCFIETKSGNHH